MQIEVLGIRLPPGERRVPLALADVAIGPLRLTCGIVRLGRGRGRLVLRMPTMDDRTPAVALPDDLWGEIETACFTAAKKDTAVRKALLRPGEGWPG